MSIKLRNYEQCTQNVYGTIYYGMYSILEQFLRKSVWHRKQILDGETIVIVP